jgi:hypothetical protein
MRCQRVWRIANLFHICKRKRAVPKYPVTRQHLSNQCAHSNIIMLLIYCHQPQLRCIHKRKFLKGRYYLLCVVNHLIVFCFIVCLRQVSSFIAICMYETCLHTINQQHDDIRIKPPKYRNSLTNFITCTKHTSP